MLAVLPECRLICGNGKNEMGENLIKKLQQQIFSHLCNYVSGKLQKFTHITYKPVNNISNAVHGGWLKIGK